jgi:hypothetical protein
LEAVSVRPNFFVFCFFLFLCDSPDLWGLKVAQYSEGDRFHAEGKFLVVPLRTATICFQLLAFDESGTNSLRSRPRDSSKFASVFADQCPAITNTRVERVATTFCLYVTNKRTIKHSRRRHIVFLIRTTFLLNRYKCYLKTERQSDVFT